MDTTIGSPSAAMSCLAVEEATRGRSRILVAGLGNLLLRDDGVGIHAVRALGADLPRGVMAVEVGTAVLDALHLFEWADGVLAIDAMEAGGAAGSIYRIEAADVAEDGPRASLHELGLLAGLRFLQGHRPQVTVLGVEPALIDYGLELSPGIAAALPRVVAAARDILGRWHPRTMGG